MRGQSDLTILRLLSALLVVFCEAATYDSAKSLLLANAMTGKMTGTHELAKAGNPDSFPLMDLVRYAEAGNTEERDAIYVRVSVNIPKIDVTFKDTVRSGNAETDGRYKISTTASVKLHITNEKELGWKNKDICLHLTVMSFLVGCSIPGDIGQVSILSYPATAGIQTTACSRGPFVRVVEYDCNDVECTKDSYNAAMALAGRPELFKGFSMFLADAIRDKFLRKMAKCT